MQDVVGYLPTINAPVTQLDLASVRGHQEDFKSTRDCGFHGPSTFTPKLVRSPGSTKISTLKFLTLRLGTFHTIFNHLSIIGKRL